MERIFLVYFQNSHGNEDSEQMQLLSVTEDEASIYPPEDEEH